MPLPGLSKTNTKLMVYYEGRRLQRLRGPEQALDLRRQRGQRRHWAATPTLKYIQGSSWVSAQIGYESPAACSRAWACRFEGNNLNKPVYRQLNPDGSASIPESSTGASVAFKISYKLQ